MLSDITSALENGNPGIASFETFAADCLAEMARDPDNACLYFVLGQTARQFHEQFADQPVTVERAAARRKVMVALAREAEAALGAAAADKLAVANRIAVAAATAD